MSESQESKAEKKKGLPVKTIAVVLVMLIAEAGLIFGAIMFFGQPSPVQGTELVQDPGAEGERLQEIPVLHDKFANNSTGRLWYWDTEILMQAKAKHAPGLSAELEERAAEVRTGVGAVIASAQHSYFNEPGRHTLTRQLEEYLHGVFGEDAEGEVRVAGVLIPKCIGFPADY